MQHWFHSVLAKWASRIKCSWSAKTKISTCLRTMENYDCKGYIQAIYRGHPNDISKHDSKQYTQDLCKEDNFTLTRLRILKYLRQPTSIAVHSYPWRIFKWTFIKQLTALLLVGVKAWSSRRGGRIMSYPSNYSACEHSVRFLVGIFLILLFGCGQYSTSAANISR